MFSQPTTSLQGQLLIASTELRDPNFARSVVLVFRHDADGAIGLILNRRTKATVKQVWEQVSDSPCQSDAPLHLGGPLQGPLMAIHCEQLLYEIEVMPGLYFSTTRENLERLVTSSAADARFFVGYAGWGTGQLEKELEGGFWLTTPATAEHIFDTQDDLWKRLTRHVTSTRLLEALQIKHVPPDPSLN